MRNIFKRKLGPVAEKWLHRINTQSTGTSEEWLRVGPVWLVCSNYTQIACATKDPVYSVSSVDKFQYHSVLAIEWYEFKALKKAMKVQYRRLEQAREQQVASDVDAEVDGLFKEMPE